MMPPSQKVFQVTIWTLCTLSSFFFASRMLVRYYKKGTFGISDYILIVALLALFAGTGLLQTSLDALYADQLSSKLHNSLAFDHQPSAPRLLAAIELLWVAIYCVKASFFAQFKFFKSPYAYVSPRLTRYYWIAVCICASACLFTLIVQAVLCPSTTRCRYFGFHNTKSWEIALISVDISTDLLVISIPLILIWMSNTSFTQTLINTSFKSLSVCTLASAACRLSNLHHVELHRVDYLSLLFWLVVEAAVAMVMASMSSYRIVVLDWLRDRRARHPGISMESRIWDDQEMLDPAARKGWRAS